MRGLLWDDLDEGDLGTLTEKLIREWEKQFAQAGVVLTHCKDYNDFLARFLAEKYDFVMIDFLDRSGEEAGLGYAREVRDIARRGAEGRLPDPDFPIFLVSREIDGTKVTELARVGAIPISKHSAPSLVVHTVSSTLHPLGRWVSRNTAFLIARVARQSEAGKAHADDNLQVLRSIVERAGLVPEGLAPGAGLGSDTLSSIQSGILSARKIIALLTPDEEIVAARAGVMHVARPNVYLELGLVGAQPSTLRKTLLVCAENVLFPSDFGGRLPQHFHTSVREVEDVIYQFLRGD
jgi:hypothetical protein